MELIQTNAITAKMILESGNRIIKATKGKGTYKVVWVNINNNTCGLSSRKGHEFMQNCEDLIFFIQVPKNAKSVY